MAFLQHHNVLLHGAGLSPEAFQGIPGVLFGPVKKGFIITGVLCDSYVTLSGDGYYPMKDRVEKFTDILNLPGHVIPFAQANKPNNQGPDKFPVRQGFEFCKGMPHRLIYVLQHQQQFCSQAFQDRSVNPGIKSTHGWAAPDLIIHLPALLSDIGPP